MVRVKYKDITNYVGPFAQKVLAENWVSTCQDWLELNWIDKYLYAKFKVIEMIHPYKTRTVSVLTIISEEE
jgi:hypothetical protein